MTKDIGVKIIKTEPVNWRELQFIQQDNFKELSDSDKCALKASIVADDFIQPFYVWQDTDGMLYCLDGKHRRLLLEELANEGYNIPYLLPATFIECKDKQHAARIVLKFSSQYAKVSRAGLHEFITIYDLDWSEVKEQIDLPTISIERFEQQFDLHGITDQEADEDKNFGIADVELKVKHGDVFRLGNHILACGSFKDNDIVNQLMQGDKARIVFCDPPYNLPTNFFSGQNHKDFAEAAGEMTHDEFVEFLKHIMVQSGANTVEGGIHYICMDHRHVWHMTEAARQVYGNPEPKQMITWVKDIMANGSFYRAQQELVFVFNDDNSKALWNNDMLDEGGFYKTDDELVFIFKNGEGAKHLSHLELQHRIRTNVWRYPSATSTANPDRYELKNHPTPKPVAMVADAILDTTNGNDLVIDWFAGSGTTLIACEKTNRRARCTEVEPGYVQSIINRYYRYCIKMGRQFNFEHLNGNLVFEDICETEVVV